MTNVADPCGCGECAEFGVEHEPQRRVPSDIFGHRWLHGRELRRWLDARARFFEMSKRTLVRGKTAGEWVALSRVMGEVGAPSCP